jgi:hypothetical protein
MEEPVFQFTLRQAMIVVGFLVTLIDFVLIGVIIELTLHHVYYVIPATSCWIAVSILILKTLEQAWE